MTRCGGKPKISYGNIFYPHALIWPDTFIQARTVSHTAPFQAHTVMLAEGLINMFYR